MMSVSLGNVIRQKATVETVFEMDNPVTLCGPREDSKGNLYVCSQAGEIIKFTDSGHYEVYLTLGGQPSCVAFESKENKDKTITTVPEGMYLADVANAVIYEKKSSNDIDVLIKDYEGSPLNGPTSLSYNQDENSLLFCDAGYFGSTSFNRPYGSAFLLELESNICKPLLLNCLSYPADIYYDNNTKLCFIAETFQNRIIRLTQSPQTVYHASVFYQFSGRVGPTAIAIDEMGNIYISRFEYRSKEGVDGVISVLSREGDLLGELTVPHLPEIVGMCIPREGKNKSVLYFTERSFNGVKKIQLANFALDIEKVHEKI